jgi:lipoprotein-anchoring transpeptidase ErfK/SrfK
MAQAASALPRAIGAGLVVVLGASLTVAVVRPATLTISGHGLGTRRTATQPLDTHRAKTRHARQHAQAPSLPVPQAAVTQPAVPVVPGGATTPGGTSTGSIARPTTSIAPQQPTTPSAPRGQTAPNPPVDLLHQRKPQASATDRALVPSETVLATLHRRTPGFHTASATRRAKSVPEGWYGRTSTLPVLAESGSRLKVRLARRPNEATTWVNRSDVILSSTDTAVLVDISQHRLFVFANRKQIGSYPVGVGLPQTPTPTGTYFLAFHAPPNGPGYGPVMLETSAHSTVFTTFEGGNDAIIAIHGPIDSYADEKIGTHGAAISNGCIRMHDRDLVKVARVPDGTPIILAP